MAVMMAMCCQGHKPQLLRVELDQINCSMQIATFVRHHPTSLSMYVCACYAFGPSQNAFQLMQPRPPPTTHTHTHKHHHHRWEGGSSMRRRSTPIRRHISLKRKNTNIQLRHRLHLQHDYYSIMPPLLRRCARAQVAAQELLHVAIGNDATSSSPVAKHLRAFFQSQFVVGSRHCVNKEDCPGSILSWLRFSDSHSLHVCGADVSGAAAAAAWSMLKRSLSACSLVGKAAMLTRLPNDLQPDLVEAVLVDAVLLDVEQALDVESKVSRSRSWPLLPQQNPTCQAHKWLSHAQQHRC